MRAGGLAAIGTTKGVFVVTPDGVGGPFFPGERVPSILVDVRHDPVRIVAGVVSEHWGPVTARSDDLGASWGEPQTSLRFPADAGASLEQVWQLQPGPPDQPDTINAGVEPAALFRSADYGATWELERTLWDHPHRAQWEPGFGGLGLHTIVADPRDPERLLVAISAGGVYRTDDGGASWSARNEGVHIADTPNEYAEFGQCVHKVARDGVDPDRLYMQNHGGLYRSDDFGSSWADVVDGVPSDFGFPVIAHPSRADTAYVVPLESSGYRCTPDGRCRVYRTSDAGKSWEALTDGLPQEHAHLTVLRDALCHDGADPAGIYFGTRTGQVFASADDGDSWELLVEHLPPVLCVRATVV